MRDIFLCHSTTDKPFTRKLARRFENMGVGIWIDEAEIKIGDSLLKKISGGIIDCKYLVAVLSSRSVQSSWVQTELEIASTMEINGKPIMVLPVVIDECEIPPYLTQKKYADFKNDDFDASFEQLLAAVLPFDLRASLCEVVRSAGRVEFDAYKALPAISTDNLLTYFTGEGSALNRIVHLLGRHSERGWTISNAGNPSTAEILDVDVVRISDGTAELKSREYWYLRWYDRAAGAYKHVLNETIHPTHILKRCPDGAWRIVIQKYTTTTCYVG